MSTSDSIPFDDWRIKVLSSNDNKYSKLLDPVEKVAYQKFKTWMPCDLFLAACFILPSIITRMEEHYITVELGGFHCRAMMVIDHLKDNKPNARIIKEIDNDMFKKFILWVCNHPTMPELENLFINTCVLDK
jgi:inosine-uridine nucleoside N-ribohydrolase